MDLSFSLSPADGDPDAELPAAELAQLVALIADLHTDSATARAQAMLDDACPASPGDPLAPADGAFNAGMAARLTTWRQK